MGLPPFKFVQWAAKDASILQQSAGRKRILTWNSRSRSFKVIHFAISFWPTRGSMSPYNIAGLISEDSEEVATQIAKKLPSSSTPLSFDASSKRNPRAYPHKPYISRNWNHWHIFLSLIVSVYLHSNLCNGLQKTHLFCNSVHFRHSRSSKVDDFGTNRKRACDFLLVRHCDYGPILHRFWDTATYWLKIAYFSYPSLIRRSRSP